MRSFYFSVAIIFVSYSCVDRIDFDTAELSEGRLVVEGSITDQEGPYTVKLFKSSSIEADLLKKNPINAKEVTIFDDFGVSESLTAISTGIYQSSENGMRGIVGRKYSLRIELLNGKIYESRPDKLNPTAEIDSLYSVWESFRPLDGPTQYGFRIFMDTKSVVDRNVNLRWKFNGVYQVLTYPEYKLVEFPKCVPGQGTPLPCSGYEVKSGVFQFTGECTCCQCWVTETEKKPLLSSREILTDGTFKKVEVGYVPFDKWRFRFQKYMVKVEQLSLSEEAFKFWKIIEDQKDGASSLFQPAFGKVRTNIESINSSDEVIGFFYASALRSRVLYITSSDSPISVPPIIIEPETLCFFWDACDEVYVNSSRTPPSEWK